jgi:hypothetical protein
MDLNSQILIFDLCPLCYILFFLLRSSTSLFAHILRDCFAFGVLVATTKAFIIFLINFVVSFSFYHGVAFFNGQLLAAVVTIPLSFALSKFFVFASK